MGKHFIQDQQDSGLEQVGFSFIVNEWERTFGDERAGPPTFTDMLRTYLHVRSRVNENSSYLPYTFYN